MKIIKLLFYSIILGTIAFNTIRLNALDVYITSESLRLNVELTQRISKLENKIEILRNYVVNANE